MQPKDKEFWLSLSKITDPKSKGFKRSLGQSYSDAPERVKKELRLFLSIFINEDTGKDTVKK